MLLISAINILNLNPIKIPKVKAQSPPYELGCLCCLNLLKTNSKVYLGDALCFDKHPYLTVLTVYLIFHFYGIITALLAEGITKNPYLTFGFFVTGTVLAPIFAFAGIFLFPHVAIPYFLIAYGLLYYYVRKEKRRVDVENVV